MFHWTLKKKKTPIHMYFNEFFIKNYNYNFLIKTQNFFCNFIKTYTGTVAARKAWALEPKVT